MSDSDRITDELTRQLISGDFDNLPRPYQMARLYALGQTLQEIGDGFGITREGVRQNINKRTPWSTAEIIHARQRVLAEQDAQNHRAVQDWSVENLGHPVSRAAEDLGIDVEEVRRHLGRRLPLHESGPRRVYERRGEDELLADLRTFHDETGQTSAAAYARWARSAGVPGPQTVAIRFGSWNEATTRAGIKHAAPVERTRRHSDEDLWAAVIECVRAGHVTARGADEWLTSVPGAPSLALIRQRLQGTWVDLRDEAIRIVNRESKRSQPWLEDVCQPRNWSALLEVEDPIIHMQDARLALGPNITMVRYRAWAQANGRPGAVTVLRRSGRRWAELVASVGGNTVQKDVRIADEELLAWLRAFLDAEPNGSYSAYEDWREPLGAPSASTISMRFGGWERAILLAGVSE